MIQEEPYLFLVDSEFILNETAPPEIKLIPEQYIRAKELVEKYQVQLPGPPRFWDNHLFSENFRLIYGLSKEARHADVIDLLMDIIPADVTLSYAIYYEGNADSSCIPVIERGIHQTAKIFGPLAALNLLTNVVWGRLPAIYQDYNNPYEENLGLIMRQCASAALEKDAIAASRLLLSSVQYQRPQELQRDISAACITPLQRAGNADPLSRYRLATEAVERLISSTPNASEDPVVQNALKFWLETFTIDTARNVENHADKEAYYAIELSRIGAHIGDDLLSLFEKRVEGLMTSAKTWHPKSPANVAGTMREQWALASMARAVFKNDSIPLVNPNAGSLLEKVLLRHVPA